MKTLRFFGHFMMFGAVSVANVSAGSGSLGIRWIQGGTPLGVASLQFAPDGERLVSADAGGVKVWSVPEGKLLRSFGTMFPDENLLALSADGEWAASALAASAIALPPMGEVSMRSPVSIRSLESGEILSSLPITPDAFLMSLSFSPDRSRLAVAKDRSIEIWDIESRRLQAALPSTALDPALNWMGGLALLSANELIAATGTGLYRARIEPFTVLWQNSNQFDQRFALSADGSVCAGAVPGAILVIRTSDGELLRHIPTEAEIAGIAISAEGTRVAGSLPGNAVQVWSTEEGALVHSLAAGGEFIFGLGFSRDDRFLAAGHRHGISLWDLSGPEAPSELVSVPSLSPSLSVSANGIVAVGGVGRISLFESGAGDSLGQWQAGSVRQRVAIAPSGTWLASHSSSGSVVIYNVPDGTVRATLPPSSTFIDEVAVSPDELWLAVARESELVLVSTADWSPVHTFSLASEEWVGSLAYSPDNALLAAGIALDGIRVWNVAEGTPVRSIPTGERSRGLRFTGEGRNLIGISPAGRIRTWDVSTGELAGESIIGATNVAAAMFLPDHSAVLTGRRNEPIRMWRTDTGGLVGVFTRDTLPGALAISPLLDGRSFAFTRWDGSLVAADLPHFLRISPGPENQIFFEPAGIPGTFQLEHRALEGAAWEAVGRPFSSPVSLSVPAGSGGMFRSKLLK